MPPTPLLERLKAALADRYEVQRQVGKGGMATVYLARDLRHARAVAIKVLSPELATGLNPARFLAEIRTAANLQHPHILPLFDSGEADGLLYFTMPFVDGVTLETRLGSRGPVGLEEFLSIVREVGGGLAYAHRQGLVHRDVKPSNILLSNGHALLADFGLARAVEMDPSEGLTRTGVVLGTSYYMSPEQALGERDIDARSDVYSLGCVCYQMLTGEPPFTGHSHYAVVTAHVRNEIPSASAARPDVPSSVSDAIVRAMAKEPAGRFASVDDFLRALAGTGIRVAAPSPEPGRSPEPEQAPSRERGRLQKGKRWAARWPSAAPHPTLILLTLLAALALVVYQASDWLGGRRDAPASLPRLVVLPFDNLGSSEFQYFTDGITEELTGRLGSAGRLSVIGRVSAMQYRDTDKPIGQIAEELDVDYVVDGSVQWSVVEGSDPMLRVRSSLIRADDGEQIWFETYGAELVDVFGVQSSIAQQVVDALGLILVDSQRRRLARQPTTDVQAYQLYLQGNDYYNRSWAQSDVERAVESYSAAVERDPRFALALASLGRTHAWMYQLRYDRSDERLQAARVAADSALALDPELPEAHVAQGAYYYWGHRDYASALDHFERAVALNPSDAYAVNAIANIRRRQGEFGAALTNYERATEIDPRTPVAWYNLGGTRLFVRRFDEADSALDRAISLAPDLSDAYLQKMRVAIGRDADLAEARQLLDRADAEVGPSRWRASPKQIFQIVLSPEEALERLRPGDYALDSTRYHFALGEVLDQLGQADSARVHWDEARARMERVLAADAEQHWVHSDLGVVYAQLGREEDALRSARRAIEMLPVTQDALDGPEYVINLAWVHTVLGAHDQAVEQLERALSVPSWLTIGLLRTEPRWAPLRNHPGFRALTSDAAPPADPGASDGAAATARSGASVSARSGGGCPSRGAACRRPSVPRPGSVHRFASAR